MDNETKIEIICNDELVNKHSNHDHYGWTNPIDIIPSIGSIIEYMTFNQNRYKGVLTKYLVKSYCFSTEEDFNGMFRNKICKIYVSLFAEVTR